MKIMKENDTFTLLKSMEAIVIGQKETVIFSEGQVVSVVFVFGDPGDPVAYEVEAFLDDTNRYALATLEASDVQ